MKYRILTLWIFCLLAILPRPAAHGQQVLRLVEYTNVWRYDQSGRDLGTEWRAPGYDDSAWPAGPGLLGLETRNPFPYPVPLNTPLALGTPPVITYYFRTTFELPQIPAHLWALRARLYCDDGCVVYLNGTEVARLRVPTNQNYLTAGQWGPLEGVADIVDFDPAALVPGNNVLAVEFHQPTDESSDVVWGLNLQALLIEPVRFVEQPADNRTNLGRTNTFAPVVEGGPASYQWFKDGALLTDATNLVLVQRSLGSNSSGFYHLIASNRFGTATSRTARLMVVASRSDALDFSGPRLVMAAPFKGPTAQTEGVDISFDEGILPATATLQTISLRALDDDSIRPLTGVSPVGSSVRLRFGAPDPLFDGSRPYYVSVTGVRDGSPNTNMVAPDSRILVEFPGPGPEVPNVVAPDAEWSYHAFLRDDPSMIEAQWWKTNFVENSFWQKGTGNFYTVEGPAPFCFGPIGTRIPYQFHPVVFRRQFEWTGPAIQGTLVVNSLAMDGLVVFLDGKELFRNNLTNAPAPLTVDTRALARSALCRETRIANVSLSPGIHHLACAVFQYEDFDFSPPFGFVPNTAFALSARFLDPTAIVPTPPLQWTLQPEGLVLSWTGSGFALKSSTELIQDTESPFDSTWREVPATTHSITIPISDPNRFFRLIKK